MEVSNDNLLRLNGTSLYAIKEGQGEAVVFMHGFGLDHRMWKRQMDVLRSSYTVINYDLRGFGESALPDQQTPYTHEDDYLALIHHFGFQRAHIIASSMGGRMALRCALTCQHAVSSLLVLDSIIDGHVWSVSWLLEWSNIVSAAKDNALDVARDLWMQHSLFVHANSDPVIAAELETMIGKYSGWHWIYKDPALVPQPPAINRLEQIAVPTLVMAGEHDIPDFREAANKLYHDIPNAQRFDVQGSGHMVNMESPDIVNDAILNFLGNISA